MKGGFFRRAGLFVLLLLLFSLPLPVCAAEWEAEKKDTLPEEVADEYGELLSGLPEDLRDRLPEGIYSDSGDEIAGAVEEMLSFSFLSGVISDAIGLHLGDALRLLARLVGILLLASLASALRRSFSSETLGRAVSTVFSCALLAAIVGGQLEVLSEVSAYFSALTDLASGMVPLMGVLYAVGGNVGGAAVSGAGMMLFLSVAETVGKKLVLPTAGTCMALALLPVFSPGLNLRSLTAAIKKTFTFCLGFLMMLLSALLAMRSGLAAKSDSLGARTVKYIASSMIPVVGGSVADSLRTVGASVEYLRTTLGIAGILLVVLTVLPFLLNLLLSRLVLILSASAAEVLGCEGESKFLQEMVSVYGYLLATSVMCAVMFIFALTLLVRTGAAIG